MSRYKKWSTLEKEFKTLSIDAIRAKLEGYKRAIEINRYQGNSARSVMERQILEHNFLIKILREKLKEVL